MNHNMDNLVITCLVSAVWVVFCVGIFIGFDGELSWVAIALFALFAYTSTMLWKTVFDRRIAPLEMMFWLFHTNFLLLPALSQSLYRSFYWSSYDAYPKERLLYACFIIFIGLFAYSVGANIGDRRLRRAAHKLDEKKNKDRALEMNWILNVLLIVIMIGLVALITNLGADYFLSSRSSKLSQVESLTELGLLLNLPRALAMGILIFAIALMVQRRRQRKRISVAVLLILFGAIGLNAIINYPLSIARFWLFGFLISLIWIVPPRLTATWRSGFIIAMTMLQFTVFPWYSEITREKGGIDYNLVSIRQYLHHGDFDGFQSIVNIILYIQDNGLELGRNLISIILFAIPRTLWNKAEPLGTAAADYMGYIYSNLSAPIYGELYADYGIFSLVLGMSLIGVTLKYVDAYYDRKMRNKQFGAGVLLTGVVAGYFVIILRGSLLGVLPGIAALLGILIILCWLATRVTILGNRTHHIDIRE